MGRNLLRTKVTQEGLLTGTVADKIDLFGTRAFSEVPVNVLLKNSYVFCFVTEKYKTTGMNISFLARK